MNYYNENDPYAAQWLKNLIVEGLIPDGEVDARSIVDVRGSDLDGFEQCHFFAGIGGWSLALKLAGWIGPCWTGSCPCQPFSVAGKRKHQADARHLWPEWFRLIGERKPAVVFGEQVAAAAGASWLDGVFVDLEAVGYAAGAAVVPACAVGAPHRRDRLWFVANAHGAGIRNEPGRGNEGRAASEFRGSSPLAHAASIGSGAGFCEDEAKQDRYGTPGRCSNALADAIDMRASCGGSTGRVGRGWGSPEIEADTIPATVERLAQSGIRLLAHGVPARVGRLRAYGNAIVPQVAAEFIRAFIEVRP